MNKFSVEGLYQKYLHLSKLDESKMHEVQRTETKRAFYGAIGLFADFISTDLSQIDDDLEFEKALDEINDEVLSFWQKQKK